MVLNKFIFSGNLRAFISLYKYSKGDVVRSPRKVGRGSFLRDTRSMISWLDCFCHYQREETKKIFFWAHQNHVNIGHKLYMSLASVKNVLTAAKLLLTLDISASGGKKELKRLI